MKHPKRTLIALLICVVGLVAVLLALHFAPSGESSSSSESNLQTTSLYSHKDSDLVSMTVKNAQGSYTIVPDKEATAKAASAASASAAAASSSSAGSSSVSSAAATKTVFKINELSGLTVNSETIGSAAQDGYSLSALKTIGSAASLADYGLKNPAATFTSTFSDGSKVTVLVGNETPLDTSARYVKLEGKDTIYAATIAENLLKGMSAYASTQVTSIPTVSSASSTASGTAATAASFTKIDVKNQSGSFGLARSGQSWLVNSRPADSDKVETLTSAVSSISASSVEALDPTADQLKKYGLGSPAAELTYTAASGTGTILVGSQKAASTSSASSTDSGTDNGTYYYVMLKGGRMVYLVSSNGLPWLTEKAFDLQRTTLVTSAQTEIAGVSLQGSGMDYQMVVTRAKDESSSTEDVPSYTYTTQLNGKKLSDEKTFATFYSKITGIKILEDSTDAPSGSAVYTLTLNGFDGKVRQIYQFYKSSDRRYLVTANGVACGLVNSTDMDALLTAAKAVK